MHVPVAYSATNMPVPLYTLRVRAALGFISVNVCSMICSILEPGYPVYRRRCDQRTNHLLHRRQQQRWRSDRLPGPREHTDRPGEASIGLYD